jgi:hypothetical protein
MLGDAFRRQLLMDGSLGALCFVATHADVMVASELRASFAAGPDATRKELAALRSAQCEAQVRADFLEGVREARRGGGGGGAAAAAGGGDDDATLAARFPLSVFCVSSLEYQKLAGLRRADGRAEVFDDVEETGVPALQRFLRDAGLRRRRAAAREFAAGLRRLCERLGHALEQDPAQQCRKAVEKAARGAKKAVEEALDRLTEELTGGLAKLGEDMVGAAHGAEARCVGVAEVCAGSGKISWLLHPRSRRPRSRPRSRCPRSKPSLSCHDARLRDGGGRRP